MRLFTLLTGPYDIYKNNTDMGSYAEVGGKLLGAEAGIFGILMNVATYAAVICFVVSGIMIIVSSNGKSEKLAEAKGFFVKTLLISALVFAVSFLVDVVIRMGMD